MTTIVHSPVLSSGVHKAAVLLVQLGKEKAAGILAHLGEAEVEAISAEIARMQVIESGESTAVMAEFRDLMTARAHVAQGGIDVAQQLLRESFGEERAAEITERLKHASLRKPFALVAAIEPAQLLSFIVDEHPQVVALVVAHLSPDRAATLLSGLTPDRQAQVAHRIAVMDRTTPETVRMVESILERKLSSVLQPTELSRVGGLDPLVTIINRADRSTERQIVEGLESLDSHLAEQVRSRMFMFEDVTTLEDRSVQLVLRQVEAGSLAMALKGVSDAVRDKITKNLSERAAMDLLDEVELLGAVRLTQVEEAQQSVIRIIRELEAQGQLLIRRGNDDDFVT